MATRQAYPALGRPTLTCDGCGVIVKPRKTPFTRAVRRALRSGARVVKIVSGSLKLKRAPNGELANLCRACRKIARSANPNYRRGA